MAADVRSGSEHREIDESNRTPIARQHPRKRDVAFAAVGDSLTLRGERKPEPDIPEDRYYRRERPMGPFTRTLSVGEALNPDQTEATYANGILRVQLARAPEATPKKIPVKS